MNKFIYFSIDEKRTFAYNRTNVRIGGVKVKGSLLKSMQHNQIIDVIYMSMDGEVTKRRIKVIKLYGATFQAYCFLRKTKRTFKVDNILALSPVTYKERTVI